MEDWNSVLAGVCQGWEIYPPDSDKVFLGRGGGAQVLESKRFVVVVVVVVMKQNC